jgi:hypothetical protein
MRDEMKWQPNATLTATLEGFGVDLDILEVIYRFTSKTGLSPKASLVVLPVTLGKLDLTVQADPPPPKSKVLANRLNPTIAKSYLNPSISTPIIG